MLGAKSSVVVGVLLTTLGCGHRSRVETSCDEAAFARVSQRAEDFAAKGDFKAVLEIAVPCANAGLPDAEYGVAMIVGSDETGTITGLSAPQRDEEAIRWLSRAAVHGSKEAAGAIADCYENAWKGLPRDKSRMGCWRGVELGTELLAKCLEVDPDIASRSEEPTLLR